MANYYFQESTQSFQMNFQVEGDEHWKPPMDVYETPSEYVVRLEVPGMRKRDLRLGFRDNTLTVTGERHPDESDTKMKFLRMEIEYGEFRREIHFPDKVKREAVQAHYQEGFLKVVLPKDEQK